MILLYTGGKQFEYYWFVIGNNGGQKQWKNVFEVPKGKTVNTELYVHKIYSLRRKTKTFLYDKKLIARRPEL